LNPGTIVLARIPQGSIVDTKPRPALVVAKLPGTVESVLLCGISSRLLISIEGWDVLVDHQHPDFVGSGLHVPSMIRPSWLAAFPTAGLMAIGSVSRATVNEVRLRLASVLEPV